MNAINCHQFIGSNYFILFDLIVCFSSSSCLLLWIEIKPTHTKFCCIHIQCVYISFIQFRWNMIHSMMVRADWFEVGCILKKRDIDTIHAYTYFAYQWEKMSVVLRWYNHIFAACKYIYIVANEVLNRNEMVGRWIGLNIVVSKCSK